MPEALFAIWLFVLSVAFVGHDTVRLSLPGVWVR